MIHNALITLARPRGSPIASLLVNARTFARPLPSNENYVQHPTSSDFREGEEIARLGRNASLAR